MRSRQARKITNNAALHRGEYRPEQVYTALRTVWHRSRYPMSGHRMGTAQDRTVWLVARVLMGLVNVDKYGRLIKSYDNQDNMEPSRWRK